MGHAPPDSSDATARRNSAGRMFCKSPVRSETREERDVARRAASSQRRAQQRPVTARATDAKHTWGKV